MAIPETAATLNMTTMNIYVKPRSSRQNIEKKDGKYIVWLKNAPTNGKANRELISFLSKHFKKPVSLVRGKASRHKTILIED